MGRCALRQSACRLPYVRRFGFTCSSLCSHPANWGRERLVLCQCSFEPDRRLSLVVEMKVPGRAWLQFEVEPIGSQTDSQRSNIHQTAISTPQAWAVFSTGTPCIPFIAGFLPECFVRSRPERSLNQAQLVKAANWERIPTAVDSRSPTPLCLGSKEIGALCTLAQTTLKRKLDFILIHIYCLYIQNRKANRKLKQEK